MVRETQVLVTSTCVRRNEVAVMSPSDIQSIDAIVRWISNLFGVFAVPVIVFGLLAYLARAKSAPERISRLLAPLTSVKVFGQELTFRSSDPVTRSAVDTFLGYRDDTRDRYRALVKGHRIAELHEQLIRDCCPSAISATRFRSTIHVADILFAESYYQLLPYWPCGGGEARSWSIRYGIVGNTWRHGTSQGVVDIKEHADKLIDVWGMTSEEAQVAMHGAAQSLIAVVLRDSANRVVGLFYADALDAKVFGADDAEWTALALKIEQGAARIGLIRALSDMVADLPRSPIIPMLGKVREEVTTSGVQQRRKGDQPQRASPEASAGT
ncbi:MAG TPA: hypothetical protein VGQ89_05815 [Candidatus Limnocylindrales bacterium]|nr:hypothetical protein [Candidatus Limnocylindrales bacterium]